MKKIAALLCLALLSLNAIAGESWKRDIYESGESVYYSHNTLGVVTAAQLLVGENGVALSYFTGYEVAFSNKLCLISIDNQPDDKCDVSIGRRVVLNNSRELANRIANAKTTKFKLRIVNLLDSVISPLMEDQQKKYLGNGMNRYQPSFQTSNHTN